MLRHHVVGVLAVLVVGASACSGNTIDDAVVDESSTSTTAAESPADITPGGAVSIGIEINPTTLDPLPNNSASGPGQSYALHALYDGLTGYNELDGSVEGRLAESYEANDDFTEWTLHLREGVVFSDGSPLDSAVVAANFTFRADPANCQCSAEFEQITATPDGPLVVHVSIADGNAHAPVKLFTLPMLAAASMAPGHDRDAAPIGTGPFRLADRSTLTFARNPDYWRTDDRGRQLPFLDRITLVPISDATVRLAALRKGEIDAMEANSGPSIAAARDGDFAVHQGPPTGLTVAINNFSVAPMNNPDVRRAAAMAIDREALAASFVDGGVVPAYSFLVSAESDRLSGGQFPHHDLDAARELLDTAMRDEGWSEVALDLVCAKIPSAELTMPVVKQQLEAAGFVVTLRMLDIATFAGVLLAQNSRDFDVACSRVSMSGDPSTLGRVLVTGAETNVAGYSNPKIDELFAEDAVTTDADERAAIYQKVSDLVVEDLPYVPLLGDEAALVASAELGPVSVPHPSFPTEVSTATMFRLDG